MTPEAWLVWALAGWFVGSAVGLALARSLLHASRSEDQT